MASPPASSPTEAKTLTAKYTSSSSSSKVFAHTLPLNTTSNPSSTTQPDVRSTTSAKTAHLAALRSAVTRLQDEVNVFLTAKMDEEKANSATGQRSTIGGTKAEEENYGEEVVDED